MNLMMRQEEQNIMILPASSNFYTLESVFKSNRLFESHSTWFILLLQKDDFHNNY